ncbi:related to Mannosyl phosphorylinositol ceramide synthase CSH1 [Saccharomycodes ludwigii]|uniref:inositol phosphorylceramide mannosyltransferase n=1 Tax=Saccharomycodes ludwigii TaxID=36035 RepID=A0A376B9N3_9ASCO|nr:hypothetical protein SCDLUD_001988 [Saccharomycodes ludwigii]KAH3902173.1 hypothetical protein SCDLUD_001988 [Saccharomycodes ludwigii]SSD61395.1 related to Mannosyl phosphorylinositol ceramide synthase CSH1 [Saccharomycodes ludwigii]
MKDALLDSELNPLPNTPPKPQLIPKIIHQTYKTEDVPERWKAGQQNCIDLHPDYQYILWTDVMIRKFIAEQYPWFLETFDSYKYPIERADAMRYFVLNHYGGVYIDLDDGCNRRLDPLLTVPAFVRKTSPTGISNDVMGAVPKHPFFLKLLKSLKKYNRNWYIPYITIMSSTGPLFVSIIWKQYKRWNHSLDVNSSGAVRILQPQDYRQGPYAFFTISKGSSWHTGDSNVVLNMAVHITACVVSGFVVVFMILYCEFIFYCWLCNNSSRLGKYVDNIVSKFILWSSGTKTSSDNTGDRLISGDTFISTNKRNNFKFSCSAVVSRINRFWKRLIGRSGEDSGDFTEKNIIFDKNDSNSSSSMHYNINKHGAITTHNFNKKAENEQLKIKKNTNAKRSRKDSNLPIRLEEIILDLEHQGTEITDLS